MVPSCCLAYQLFPVVCLSTSVATFLCSHSTPYVGVSFYYALSPFGPARTAWMIDFSKTAH
jgi:hypothetical protein